MGYYPVYYFLITLLLTFAIGSVAGVLSFKGRTSLLQPLLLSLVTIPALVALVFIYLLGDAEMIHDFWRRLFLFHIEGRFLAFIVLLMPGVILLATALSLLFGYSKDQFRPTEQWSVMKGWGWLGVLIPLFLAPLIEEIGWRGYGVDSLRAYFSLFSTSLVFGLLWAIWHLPLFFIKGYYQHGLWKQGKVYALNFFVSVIVIAFLMNWVYYATNRSIPAVVLFHSMLNLSSMALRTEQFTKCLVTALLALVVIVTL